MLAVAGLVFALFFFVLVTYALAAAIPNLPPGGGTPPPPPPPLPGGSGGSGPISNAPQSGITSVADIFGLIKDLFNILFWLLILLSSVFIIYAAFTYLTASGDPEKIKKANRMIIYAVIAILVGTVAWAIPTVICNFLTGSGSCSVDPNTGLPT